MIGLFFSIRRYRKKKSVNSLILVFLTLQGVIFGIGSYIVFFTEIYRLIPLFGSFGLFFFIISLILLNLSLEKKVEQKIEEVDQSEERYRNLVLNIVDIIIELKLDLSLTYISPQVKDLLGFDPPELINRRLSQLIHPDDIEKVENALKNISKTKEHVFVEIRMKTKTGEDLEVSLRAALVKDKKFSKIIGVVRDITDQKKAEHILRDQYKKLKELDQFRSDLVRRTSHELKTPLISLFSSTQYLLDNYGEKLDKEVLRFVKMINRGGKRLKNLTDNLLDAYNIQSKKLTLKKEKMDLVQSIKDCANDLIFSLEERDLYLKEQLPDSFFIVADKARIEQVILNLLSNAIKNTPPKGLILVKLEHDERFADIIIKDTGIGLTEGEKQKLFKEFGKIERAGIDSNLDTEGSGLGLFISKEIVELHGGKLLVESGGRNKGSTFIAKIPLSSELAQ